MYRKRVAAHILIYTNFCTPRLDIHTYIDLYTHRCIRIYMMSRQLICFTEVFNISLAAVILVQGCYLSLNRTAYPRITLVQYLSGMSQDYVIHYYIDTTTNFVNIE